MPQATPPNIIFILMDDLGVRDLSCYGSEFYETPVLDRLAAEGMLFTDAYAACPVCSPTRASLMTGKYPATVGITNWIPGHAVGRLLDVPYFHELPAGEVSIAAALRQGGYRTFHIGKWHLGGKGRLPEDFGFDVNIGGCHWGNPRRGYFSPWGIPGLEDGPEGTYLTDYLTDHAVGLIRNSGDRPFFMYLSHYAVHTPIQAPADLVRKYQAKARRLGLDKRQALVEGEFFPCEHKKHLRVVRRLFQSDPVYAAMVENFDANIGRLLDALRSAGRLENTVLFFTSDNGGLATAEGSPTSNAPYAEGKGWMYDGGVREPLIAWGPGRIPPGSICSVPVTTPDFYPTLLDLAGLPPRPEQHADGVSLAPLLAGADRLDREAIFWHYPHYSNQGGTPGSAIRCGDWKLIEFFEDGRVELYNLREDPGENRDLARAEPARARRMRNQLADWREQVRAKIPEPNPNYKP